MQSRQKIPKARSAAISREDIRYENACFFPQAQLKYFEEKKLNMQEKVKARRDPFACFRSSLLMKLELHTCFLLPPRKYMYIIIESGILY